MATKRPGEPGLSSPRPSQVSRVDITPSKEWVNPCPVVGAPLTVISLFASPLVTLQVGPAKQLVNAHKAILSNIDYFAACIAPDRFIEGESNSVALPEDEFDAIVQVIHYLYTGKLEHPVSDRMSEEERRGTAGLYRKTYIAADKLCMEELCNFIMDWFINYNQWHIPSLGSTSYLISHGPEGSPLVDLSIKALACMIKYEGWDEYSEECYPNLDEEFQRYPEAALRLSKEISSKDNKKLLTPAFYKEKCKWHTHIKTSKCGSGEAAEST